MNISALVLLPMLMGGPPAGDAGYHVEGDVIQVIKAAPFKVVIDKPGDLFFWSFPAGWQASETGAVLSVTTAPAGTFTLACKVVAIDWDNKKVVQSDVKIDLIIGKLPNPPPDPDDPDDPDPPQGCEGKSTARATEVCGWTAELVPERSRGKRGDLSAVFAELASGLETGKWINYSQSNAWFLEQRSRVLSTQQLQDDWATLGSRVGNALAPLVREPRAVVIQFYKDVAEGLKP